MPVSVLRQNAERRIAGLETDRMSWLIHWRELATFILPRRYKWLITPNQWNKGSPINGAILDSTGTVACRVLASGMMSGVTSPTRPWFKLRLESMSTEQANPVNVWLSECERRMQRVFAESNFYTSMAVMYFDLVVFGTAVMLIYEDFDDVIRCFNPCAGEYYLANDHRLMVDTVYRKFIMNVQQLVQKFGIKNCSENVQRMFAQGGSNLGQEVLIGHALEPNDDRTGMLPKIFQWRELYWEMGDSADKVLDLRGYHEFPGMAPRWDLVSNDAYGRSVGMDGLGDIKQLQQETKRKQQSIDKMTNPPMLADVQLQNQPTSGLPGGITYVANLGPSTGMRPIYQVMPPVQELMQDIQQIQARIKTVCFNDLFQMISNLDTVRTATEIDARREEKLIELGPVLERFQNEALTPAINRVWGIMNRLKLLPPPPPEIQKEHIQIQFVSMLAEAQKATATGGIERLFSLVGSVAGVDPTIPDKIDFDEGIDEYAGLLAVSPKIVRPQAAVDALRANREKQQQQAALLQQTPAAAQGAQVLSRTPMASGQSALDQILGNQGAPQ